MPHDPALVAETHDWLTKAREDFEAAERLLTGGTPLPSQAVFHAQQAAEKLKKRFSPGTSKPFQRLMTLVTWMPSASL
jgi:glutathione synthase/RimK-type ligase-like ATP-grasp enzyme